LFFRNWACVPTSGRSRLLASGCVYVRGVASLALLALLVVLADGLPARFDRARPPPRGCPRPCTCGPTEYCRRGSYQQHSVATEDHVIGRPRLRTHDHPFGEARARAPADPAPKLATQAC